MNDDYSFEDKMKSLLDEEREHRYEPEQWHRLSRRLKNHDRPPVAWWQRWMPVALALLIGLTGWQAWQQRQLQRTVNTLSEQMARSETTPQTEAPVPRQSVTLYDTVYQTTVVERRVNSTAQSTLNSNGAGADAIGQWATTLPPLPAIFSSDYRVNEDNALSNYSSLVTTAAQDFQRYRNATAPATARTNSPEPRGPYYITGLISTAPLQRLPRSSNHPRTRGRALRTAAPLRLTTGPTQRLRHFRRHRRV